MEPPFKNPKNHTKVVLKEGWPFMGRSLKMLERFQKENGLVRFTWPQELTATGSHCSPQVGGELLGVLVCQDQLRHGTLPKTTRCSSRPRPALFLHQLTVDQHQEFALHRPAEHTSCTVVGGWSADSSTTTCLNQRLLEA